jgi:hypothetical protein
MLDSGFATLTIGQRTPSKRTLLLYALAVIGVLGLHWVERQWPVVGWVLFLALTLSLGMAHGMLDIVIMRYNPEILQGQWPAWALCMFYLASTLAVFVLAVQSFVVALLVLIGLSLWHTALDGAATGTGWSGSHVACAAATHRLGRCPGAS